MREPELLGGRAVTVADVKFDAEPDVELGGRAEAGAGAGRQDRQPRVEPQPEALLGVEPHAAAQVTIPDDRGGEGLLRGRQRDRRAAADDGERLDPAAGPQLDPGMDPRLEPEHVGRLGPADGVRAGRRDRELELGHEPGEERAGDPTTELHGVLEFRMRARIVDVAELRAR